MRGKVFGRGIDHFPKDISMKKPKYLTRVFIEKSKVVNNCKVPIVTDRKLKNGDQECSLIDWRVTWGAKKEKVELKDPNMYVESSIKNEYGEIKSKQDSTKDTKMNGFII